MALTQPSSYLCPCSSVNRSTLINKTRPPKLVLFNLKPRLSKLRYLPIKISNCVKSTNPRFPKLDLYPDEHLQISSVCLRLRRLVSEFRSLPEPIDRVKRLLDYAAVLPKLGESTRAPENRVPGCAAQVWLEVEMDEMGRIRVGADSDSEITKGFCSCLIFLLDGAYPEDVLKVKAEDLADMNVGLPVRSRVNSWHNVLVNMQERTKGLVAQREEMSQLNQLKAFPSLVIPASRIINKELFGIGQLLEGQNETKYVGTGDYVSLIVDWESAVSEYLAQQIGLIELYTNIPCDGFF